MSGTFSSSSGRVGCVGAVLFVDSPTGAIDGITPGAFGTGILGTKLGGATAGALSTGPAATRFGCCLSYLILRFVP